VIVALNLNTSAIQQGFSLTTGSTTSFAVYSTSQTRNCEEGMDIVATNGSFVVTLEPSSISTFISR
jgi:O-glycosyl hydrolase